MAQFMSIVNNSWLCLEPLSFSLTYLVSVYSLNGGTYTYKWNVPIPTKRFLKRNPKWNSKLVILTFLWEKKCSSPAVMSECRHYAESPDDQSLWNAWEWANASRPYAYDEGECSLTGAATLQLVSEMSLWRDHNCYPACDFESSSVPLFASKCNGTGAFLEVHGELLQAWRALFSLEAGHPRGECDCGQPLSTVRCHLEG